MTYLRHGHLLGAGILLAMAVPPLSALALGAGPHVTQSPRMASICGSPPSRTLERQYTVRARVRPLVFWTGRREVGDAWFVSRAAANGGKRLELLIGTDPARTPMHINRWGYIAETVCEGSAELLGLMTESNEQTIEQAQAKGAGDQHGQVVKAIRARYVSGEAATEIQSVSPPASLTYRDLDAVLALLRAPGAAIEGAVPPGADSGFLVAVSGLIHESVLAHRDSSRERTGLHRTYVHGDRIYDVTLGESTVTSGSAPAVIESEFEVRNRTTGSTTGFRIAYPVTGSDAEVPVRIIYRPRWWLELELQREAGR